MINPDKSQEHPRDWKSQLKTAGTPAGSLTDQSLLEGIEQYLSTDGKDSSSFPYRVPQAFVDRMLQHPDWHRILRQFLPSTKERLDHPLFIRDPVHDRNALVGQGILHKYAGRVLLITTGACPVHCRYCFRRHFDYAEQTAKKYQFMEAIEYIREHTDVHEVILSGGDPLSVDDEILNNLLIRLQAIPHVKTLRIHTRFPIVVPERMTTKLCHTLRNCGMRLVVVLHCNHFGELDRLAQHAITKLVSCGALLLNQSVLLRGVNDDVSTLTTLSLQLHQHGVLPYYLHLLDPVKGSSHFWIDDQQAIYLHKAIQARLPGYLVPRLVRETPEMPAKQLIFGEI